MEPWPGGRFYERAADGTEVTLTYRQLHRHGEFGQQVWHAVASASPGESLRRYADAVARHQG
jgi:hypothetical protein